MGWREYAETLPNLAPVVFDVTSGRVALIIVDMQYVDAHRDYGLAVKLRDTYPEACDRYFTEIETTVLPNCVQLLEAFRAAGELVVHITYGPELADGRDIPVIRRRPTPRPPGIYSRGTFEHQILPELAPLDGEPVLNKTSRSAFASTGLDQMLRNIGIDTVVVVGVTTSSCIENTARAAADLGYQTVVVEDAVAEFDEESHNATLRQMAIRLGRVWTTQETLGEIKRVGGGG
ncbi:MAG: cysteine hydrolase [Nocardioidaceae bacterium]|nr:MAG: cysteine hydrolase [Nocardioidaceae bacterium]